MSKPCHLVRFNKALCYGVWYIPAVPRADKGTHSTGTGSSVLLMTRLAAGAASADCCCDRRHKSLLLLPHVAAKNTLEFRILDLICEFVFASQTRAATQVKYYILSYIRYELEAYRILWELFAFCTILVKLPFYCRY